MPSSKRPEPVNVAQRLSASRRVPLIMGIVNVTPDSFYAESRSASAADAVQAALRLREEGADIIDVGGQSTRPGSDAITLDEECRRVLPVVEALAQRCLDVPISVDTDKAFVARQALAAGASIINDVSALRADKNMAASCLSAQAVILMHRGGDNPKTMQQAPAYGARGVVADVKDFLAERKNAFVCAGGDGARVLVDPGIGFGKNLEHNLSLLKHLSDFSSVAPVVLGASRKSFLGRLIADAGPQDRLEGSLTAACWAAFCGAAIVRVHDVRATRRAFAALEAVLAAA